MRRTSANAVASQALERCEQALASWQFSWDNHAQAVALGQRETQVERARIEQLESQQRRLLQQQDASRRSAGAFAQLQPPAALETLAERAEHARAAGESAAAELQALLAEISATREREREQSQSLNALRAACSRRRASRSRPRHCSRPRLARPPAR